MLPCLRWFTELLSVTNQIQLITIQFTVKFCLYLYTFTFPSRVSAMRMVTPCGLVSKGRYGSCVGDPLVLHTGHIRTF